MELVIMGGGVVQHSTENIIFIDWDDLNELRIRCAFDDYQLTTEEHEEIELLVRKLREAGYEAEANDVEDFAVNHLGDD